MALLISLMLGPTGNNLSTDAFYLRDIKDMKIMGNNTREGLIGLQSALAGSVKRTSRSGNKGIRQREEEKGVLGSLRTPLLRRPVEEEFWPINVRD